MSYLSFLASFLCANLSVPICFIKMLRDINTAKYMRLMLDFRMYAMNN